MSFFQNTCKPKGLGGSLMVNMMNIGHSPILCPVCGNKTRTMIQENTEMRNFPLYCPKCKKETIINVQDMKITLAVSK